MSLRPQQEDFTEARADELYGALRDSTMRWTDRLFAGLMLVQWLACIFSATWVSPRTWIGFESRVHPHLLAAVCLGGAIASLPVALACYHPGRSFTRHTMAVSQMLFGSMLIHLTGGRIETHFHVFGSLAFLAFYRDWRVLITGSLVVALDHFIRGVWWPLSVFGDAGSSPGRWVEHAGWVVFMDVFMVPVAKRSNRELRMMAARQAALDSAKAEIEATVAIRRRQLAEAMAVANAANRTKSEFLANMSHEIRTPLTTIMGFADLLREDAFSAGVPETRLPIIDSIKNAGTHLLTIINDILDLSKIEADKMTLERVDTSLTKVLRELESMMRAKATSKGLVLTSVLASPVPEVVKIDPTRLRQILMNLLGNAVKFTEAGSVAMTTSCRQRHDGQWQLTIDVEDTGPGLSAEQCEMLFTPFHQGDNAVTRMHGGTGLGLAISRRLAGLMGGTITIARTQPGKGSCFRVDLPLEVVAGTGMISQMDAVQENRAAEPHLAAASLSGRILLAEDGVDNQRLIAFHLRKAGAEVEIVANGRVALERLDAAAAKGLPFALLLTDMQMPEMDGYTLARTLRARGGRIPIVALTAHAMAGDRQKCLDAGCDDYASKPIDKAALLATCQKWMERGGVSQMDTWDPKPEAPVDHRRPYAPISTSVPGVQFTSLMPNIARHADKLSVVRSMASTPAADHIEGCVEFLKD